MSLPLPCLCLVTDRRRCAGRPLEDVVEDAVSGGASLVQLREKDLPASELASLARRLREITHGRALLFVNDRIDVALVSGADGVQLGEHSLSVSQARDVAGTRLMIGRSVHSVEGAAAAASAGADLLLVGPIFPTESHPGEAGHGPTILERLRGRVDVAYLGIGGIDSRNVDQVMAAGASGAAVITAITLAEDPVLAARVLARAVSRSFAGSTAGLSARAP